MKVDGIVEVERGEQREENIKTQVATDPHSPRRYRVLGPLEVCNEHHSVALGEGGQRTVLILLLLHHNEAVSTDRLIDALWGDAPPATAAKVLQNHVSQLRRALEDREGPAAGTQAMYGAIHFAQIAQPGGQQHWPPRSNHSVEQLSLTDLARCHLPGGYADALEEVHRLGRER